MEIPFSTYPGRHERHFKRKLKNPLFPRPIHEHGNDDLLAVQKLDHEEIIDFLQKLKKLVNQAVNLDAKADSDVVLDLKAELEKQYETACRLGDQQGNNKAAIRDLLKIIMVTISRHAGGDSKAENELMQEQMAREQHFAMLENALVADLLDPDSVIKEDELPAVMLSEDEQQVRTALTLLSDEHRQLLLSEAGALLIDKGLDNADYQQRLEMIRSA